MAVLALARPLAAVAQKFGLKVVTLSLVGKSRPVWSFAVTVGARIPRCVAAVITGGAFGDVTSPGAGMTTMSSSVARADHAKYLRYAAPYNFAAAGFATILPLVVGFFL